MSESSRLFISHISVNMTSQQNKIEDQTKDDYPAMRSVDVGKPPKERKRQLVNKEASAAASPKLRGDSTVDTEEFDLTKDSPDVKPSKRKLFTGEANDEDDNESSIEEFSDSDGDFSLINEPVPKKRKVEQTKAYLALLPETSTLPEMVVTAGSKVKQERRKSPKRRQTSKQTAKYVDKL